MRRAPSCQAFLLVLWNAIETISHFLEELSVLDDKSTSPRFNKTQCIELLQNDGNTWPSHTEHHRQEFMRQRYAVAVEPVMCHDQPSRQAGIDLGATVCQGGIRRLHHKCLHSRHECLSKAQTRLEGCL